MNQIISIRFVDIQIFDINVFQGGATSLDPFLNLYKTSEKKSYFPYELFDHPEKMQNTEFFPYDAFYSGLRSFKHLEAENTEFVNLFRSGLSTEQDVVKLKLSKPPLCGIEKYEYLQQKRKQ